MSASFRPLARLAPLVVVATILLASPVLRAQETPPPSPEAPADATPRPVLSFQLVAGSSLGGPEEELSGQVNSPDSSLTSRFSLWFAGRGPIGKGHWQYGLGCAWTNLGEFEGHPAGPGGSSGSANVTIKTSILSAGPMLWFDPAPFLQLGVAPMLHVVDVDTGVAATSGVEPAEGTNRRWRAGVLVEVAVRFPVSRPFYVVLLGQYRRMADATVDVPAIGSTVSVHVPLSHGFVGAGVGAHF